MDDILRRSSPEAVAHQLKRLDNLAVPLWRYDVGKIPVVNQVIINEFYHYGVADADGSALKESRYEAGVPKGHAKPSMVSTRDAKRIVLFKVKTGVPLFALAEMEDMERAYTDPNKIISNHVDRRWQELPNLIPRSGDGEALKWFALAQAPEPFAIIKRDGAWYSMKSKNGKRVDNSSRAARAGTRARLRGVRKEPRARAGGGGAIDAVVTREGAVRAAQILREYAESLSKQMAARSSRR
jgi:hypothetical protein